MSDKQAQGYRVGLQEREVQLTASQDGKEFVLKHFLRQPNEKDWLEFDRLAIATKGRGRKTKIENKMLEARIRLYDKLVIRVEGYWDERNHLPLSDKTEGWKSQIPALHKSTAIDSFGEVNQLEDEEDEKN